MLTAEGWSVVLWIVRIVLVVALLGAAAALATPKDRLPLALRGVRRIMRLDRGEQATQPSDDGEAVASWKRLVAFVLVLAAVAVALAH